MPEPFDDFAAHPVTEDGHLRLALRGELDLATVAEFQAGLDRTWEFPERPVLIDLGDLRFMDSTGLRAMVQFHHRAADADREYRLVGVTGSVLRAIEISGLDQVLVIDTQSREP